MVITARTALFLWLLAISISTALTVAARRPHTPEPCVESAEIITDETSVRKCLPGATLLTMQLAGSCAKILVKCTCPHVDADAGAH